MILVVWRVAGVHLGAPLSIYRYLAHEEAPGSHCHERRLHAQPFVPTVY